MPGAPSPVDSSTAESTAPTPALSTPAPPSASPQHPYGGPPAGYPPYSYPPPFPYYYHPPPLPGQSAPPPYGYAAQYPPPPGGHAWERVRNSTPDGSGPRAIVPPTPSAAPTDSLSQSVDGHAASSSKPRRRRRRREEPSGPSPASTAADRESASAPAAPKRPRSATQPADSAPRPPESVPNPSEPDAAPGPGAAETPKPRYRRVHYKEDRFFKQRAPRDWSLSQYLEHSRPVRGVSARRAVLSRYCTILRRVARCSAADCCPPAHRARADALLRRYKEPGLGSDKVIGRKWCEEEAVVVEPEPDSSSRTGTDPVTAAAAAAAAPTINAFHIGPTSTWTYYGDVKNATNRAGDQVNTGPAVSTEKENAGARAEAAVEVEDTSDASPDEAVEDPHVSYTSSNTSEYEEQTLSATFRATYDSLDSAHKWTLRSGRAVEDVIFRKCRKAPDSGLSFEMQTARSFVIDVTSDVMRRWFEPDEWAEIVARVPPLPELDPAFVDSLIRFENVETVEELGDVLRYKHYLRDGERYDKNIHWQMEWANQVMRDMHNLYDSCNEPLRLKDNAEDWYSMHLWAAIVDKCFLNVEGITVQRKEVTSTAGSERKNRHRTSTGRGHRARLGPRLDGVIRTSEDDTYEYGALEVARAQRTTTTTKWLTDALKLSRALRDMLRRLQQRVGHDRAVVGKLQVAGVLTLGLALQVLRLSRPQGYVCLLSREHVCKVPTDVGGLREMLLLLKSVVQVKDIVKACVENVKSRPKGDLREELLKGPKELGPPLPWAADSPPPPS